MKNLILTVFAIFSVSLVTKAQEFGFKKGNFLVEGTLQASKDKGEIDIYEEQSSFGFHPQLSYFLSDKWAIGVFAGFGNQKFENKPESSSFSVNTNYSIYGVSGRYYFLDLGKRFKTFASLTSSYQTSSYDEYAGWQTPDRKSYMTNGGIGANLFLTKTISIAYTFTNIIGFESSKYDGYERTNSFYLNANSFNNIFSTGSFSLGFKF